MIDQSQPTVDTSGITRTADGQIQDGQTTTDQSNQSTNSESQATTQPTSEGKTDPAGKTLLTEDKPDDKAGEKTDDKKDSGAPEKYFDYKLPDGFTLDPAIKTEADALFKGLGLSQEAAQSLVDFYGKQITAVATAPVKAYQDLTTEWRKAAESHPDLKGKLGPGQEVNVRIAKALNGLGDPKLASDFRELMDLTGAGNNAAFIRVIDKFAQKLTEGMHVAGNGPTKASQSAPGQPAPSAAAAIWPGLANR